MQLLALTHDYSQRRPAGVYWTPNPLFLTEVATWLANKRVLEVFAGNGYLAGHLAAQGVEVRATSLLTGMDAHVAGLYHPVECLAATDAVVQYGAQSDVLLVSWPTVTLHMTAAAALWGPDKDILFIGEVTDYAQGHLGGCATDEFFDATRVVHEFESYQGNRLEHAQVRRLVG